MKAKNPPLKRFLLSKAARQGIPLSGTFELTPRCNLNCRMCYIHMTPEEAARRGRERSAAEWLALGESCARSGMLFLLLTGGEPFLRADFREIFSGLKKLGLFLTINTNGTCIDAETLEWLRQDPPAAVNLTLYGRNPQTYGRLCGDPGGYERAVRAVDLLRGAGIPVNINVSVTRQNLEDLEALIAFAKERGLNSRVATYMFPPVRSAREGEPDGESRMTPEECGLARYRALRAQQDPEEFSRSVQAILRQESNLVWDEDADCMRVCDEKMGCMAGRSAFWVTWDGRMTPCGMMNEPQAYPFLDGFDAAWQKIKEATDQIRLPAACTVCSARKICPVCGALSMAEGDGDAARRPEYLCACTREYVRCVKEEAER